MAHRIKENGSITVICGSMFSGKTEELIRLVRRAMHARKRVQVFKSDLETRSETSLIRTHDGTSFMAIAVPDSRILEQKLEPDVQIVGIEEVQFFDEGIVALCRRLADRGVQVIVAGLDQDFRGLPFTFMPTLLALADDVLKLHAICMVCGGEASRTQRLIDGRPAAWDEPTILIGAEDSYEARCRRCHKVRNIPREFQVPTERLPTMKVQKMHIGGADGKENHSDIPWQSKASENGGGTIKVGRTSFTIKRCKSETPCPDSSDGGTQLDMFPEIAGETKLEEAEAKL